MSGGLMIETRSRRSILVIEDTLEFGMNALEALRGEGDATLVTTLARAQEAAKSQKFDAILSDVHVPESEGRAPEPIVSKVLEIAYRSGTPVCFVTRADHHGMLELGDEGYVSLRAATLGDIAMTMMELSKSDEKPSEQRMFRELKASKSENVRSGSKTPEIWAKALDMALNSTSRSECVGNAIRKVRAAIPGADFAMVKGMPKLVPSGGK